MRAESTTPQSIPSPNDTNTGVLERIEKKLDSVENHLNNIEKHTAPKEEKNENPKASRAAVAGTFALIGFKLGAFFLGKIGLIGIDNPRAFMRGGFKAVEELWTNFFTFGGGKKPEHLMNDYKYSALGLAAGSILGPIVAGWIGWARGDRLEKPSDLFSHPIDSMKKIFGPAPAKKHADVKTTAKADTSPTTQIEHERVHEGVLNAAPARQLG